MHKYLCKDYMSVEFQVPFIVPCRHKSLLREKNSDIISNTMNNFYLIIAIIFTSNWNIPEPFSLCLSEPKVDTVKHHATKIQRSFYQQEKNLL